MITTNKEGTTDALNKSCRPISGPNQKKAMSWDDPKENKKFIEEIKTTRDNLKIK